MIEKIKNYWSKNKKKYGFLSLLLLFVVAMLFFYAGFHAVDLCRNELHIEKMINDYFDDNNLTLHFRLYETNIAGSKYKISDGECHIFGMSMMFFGFVLLIALLLEFFTWRYADGIQKTD